MIGKRIQNYKILSLLGEGGMGIVYKAFDLKLERYTALKILNINSTRFSQIVILKLLPNNYHFRLVKLLVILFMDL